MSGRVDRRENPRPPVIEFFEQLENTGQAAEQVKHEISRLDQAHHDQTLCEGGQNKLNYLKVQMDFYEGIINTITSENAVLMSQRAVGSGDTHVHNRIYNQMTELLFGMEHGFNRVLSQDIDSFTMMYRRLTALFDSNPMEVTGVSGAVFGAAFGAFNGLEGYCLLKHFAVRLGVIAGGCTCEATPVLYSMAGGAAIGVVVGLLAFGLFKIYRRYHPIPAEFAEAKERQHREQMERMIAGMRQMTASEALEKFRQLKMLINASFCRPVPVPVPGEECMICLEELTDLGRAVRAPNCQGPHFMHPRCWDQARETHGDARCPQCRV